LTEFLPRIILLTTAADASPDAPAGLAPASRAQIEKGANAPSVLKSGGLPF